MIKVWYVTNNLSDKLWELERCKKDEKGRHGCLDVLDNHSSIFLFSFESDCCMTKAHLSSIPVGAVVASKLIELFPGFQHISFAVSSTGNSTGN